MADQASWRLGQQTRTLQATRANAHGLWNDSAARHVNTRYLNPLESDATSVVEHLRSQEDLLEASRGHVATARAHGQTAARHAERALEELEHARHDLATAYDYITHAAGSEQQAADREAECLALAGQAGAPCRGAASNAGITGTSAVVKLAEAPTSSVSAEAEMTEDVSTDGIRLVNGRRPRNAKFAGRLYDGPGWTAEMRAKYPAGVRFTRQGFPDFSPYARATVELDGLTGNNPTDDPRANRAVGLSYKPAGHTWHHVDTRTMQLLPTDLHNAVGHTGGRAMIREATGG